MATKLKNLRITEVSAVTRGAGVGVEVLLTKRHDAADGYTPAQVEQLKVLHAERRQLTEQIEAIRKSARPAATTEVTMHTTEVLGRDAAFATIQKHAHATRQPHETIDQAAARFMQTSAGRVLLSQANDLTTMAADVSKAAGGVAPGSVGAIIYARVSKVQRPGEDLGAALVRWQETDPEAALLMRAGNFPITSAMAKNRPDIGPAGTRTVGADDATAVDDPEAAAADIDAEVQQQLQLRPWLSIEQATRYCEQLRREVQRAAMGGGLYGRIDQLERASPAIGPRGGSTGARI